MNYKLLVYLFALCALHITDSFQSKLKIEQTSATQLRAEIECKLSPQEVLLHNSIQFSSNIPSIVITKWFALKEPHTYFDPKSKKSEPVYSDTVTFTLLIESPQDIPSQAMIHMFYSTNLNKNPQEKFFALNAMQEVPQLNEPSKANLPLPQQAAKNYKKSSITNIFSRVTNCITSNIQDKELPLVLKLLFVFIIGLVMSLTPCIYPMIPITMGILQSNKAPSLLRGFLLAAAYTAGLSMTFAILGMLAAFGGAQFGSVMSNPWVVVPLVLFFVYLGFSMLGYYEMYIPRFMQPRHGRKNSGSFISAFTFGMINGTVASPCLSPGLALVLGMVTGLGNPLLGFLFLFIFGIGSSFPLLIIGTFSSSLHILPRAGMWMVEFKKVFGFLLLGMALYYLKSFMLEWVFPLTLGIYIITVAAYYLYYGFKHTSWIAKLIGVALCLAAAFTLTESYRIIWRSTSADALCAGKQFPWKSGYDAMRQQAIEQNKLLLLDFTAQWCSLCKVLEKQFFSEKLVYQEVPKLLIAVKIDCTDANDIECASARKKFSIIGYPTIVLVDPKSEIALKQWSADLNDKDPQDFIDEINSFIK